MLLAALGGGTAPSRAAESIEAALQRVFPSPATVVKDTLFLTEEQSRVVEEAAGAELRSKIVTRYVARAGAGTATIVGVAYVETHIVRTVSETLLIAIDRDGRVMRVEALDFREPPEYLPSRRWYEQFEGRPLDDELRLKRGIRTLSGATLSSVAATEAVRRALAVHRIVGEETTSR